MERLKLGIVGANPDRGWAHSAHYPGLLSEQGRRDYEVAAVSTRSMETASRAARRLGAGKSFADYRDLVKDPDVDVVVVAVKLPAHYEIVSAALAARKHVYCEWPLGRTTQEAEDLARQAREAGVHTMIGLQARQSPVLRHARDLLASGYVGDLLSVSVVASGYGWGGAIDPDNAYLFDRKNGATLLTITGGHLLDAIGHVCGEFTEIAALLATRRVEIPVIPVDQLQLYRSFQARVQMPGDGANAASGQKLIAAQDVISPTSPDQVLVNGLIRPDVPLSVHIRGGFSRGTNFLWELNGTNGDLRINAAAGVVQMMKLTLEGAQGTDKAMQPIAVPDELDPFRADDLGPVAANVARMYARFAEDLRSGTRTVPDFDLALQRHRFLDVIEQAASEGVRLPVGL